MKNKDYSIFYSWQSDIPPKHNNYFIKTCLEKAIKELARENELQVVPRLDKDTMKKTGSPSIIDSIFRKIDICQIFIADITIINNYTIEEISNRRLTPNPNVLVELGYGLNRLGWERIICLNNSFYSKVEEMPFDLRQNRISQYNYGEGIEKNQAQKELIELLKKAIGDIIEQYDVLDEAFNQSNMMSHDKKIFNALNEIIVNKKFKEVLNYIATNNIITVDHYDLFDQIEDFLNSDSNKFLIPEIDKLSIAFNESLEKMRYNVFHRNFFPKDRENINSKGVSTCDEIYTISRYLDHDSKMKIIGENASTISEVKIKYDTFRQCVKKKLFI